MTSILPDFVLYREANKRFYGVDAAGRWGIFTHFDRENGAWVEASDWQPLQQFQGCPASVDAIFAELLSFSSGFQCLGCYESVSQKFADGSYKDLGTRPVRYLPLRGLGAKSQLDYAVESELVLTKGHKVVAYKFSTKKPAQCIGIVHVFCGRSMPKGWVPEGFVKVSEGFVKIPLGHQDGR